MNCNKNNFLNLIVMGKTNFASNLFCAFSDLYEAKFIHIPNLLKGFIELYFDNFEANAFIASFNLKKPSIGYLIKDRKFYYNLLYTTLKLDDLSYLANRFKEIDDKHNLTDEQCLTLAKSFKKNIDKFIDAAIGKEDDLYLD